MTKAGTQSPRIPDLGNSNGPDPENWRDLEEISQQGKQHVAREQFEESFGQIATRQNKLEHRLERNHVLFEDRLSNLEDQINQNDEERTERIAQRAVLLPLYKSMMLAGAGIAGFGILLSVIYQSLLLAVPMVVSTAFLLYAYRNPQFS